MKPAGVLSETTIGLPAAAAMFPAGRGGKRLAPSTLTRWIKTGLSVGDRRVKLEAVKTGVWTTSVEAVARFLDAMTAAAGGQAKPVETPAAHRKAGVAAGKKLEAMGF